MKKPCFKSLVGIAAIAAIALGLSGAIPAPKYKTVTVNAPFAMEPIKEFIFPNRDFSIANYGAVKGGKTINTKAIAKAIKACNKAGGGRVVIPAGEWLTGPVHLMSNVNLYLSDGAILRFTDNPEDYLPAVMTSWEGMECYNYSPLVYAFDCENVAITGTGTLQPIMDTWRKWFKRPKPHMDALAELYTMASTDVPVEKRQMAKGENNLRPHLIHFNRCKNVLLDQFKIRESPFWTIHLYMCDGGIVRNLDVYAHGHNNDGVDLEMSRNFLIEDCKFDQGDDAVVIKAGRNQDAWRLDTPCENIVIRNCDIIKGHTLLGIGSEMSGGVKRIAISNCVFDGTNAGIRLKASRGRGGVVEDIRVDNIVMKNIQGDAFIFDLFYDRLSKVEPVSERTPIFRNIHLSNVTGNDIKRIGYIKGIEEMPISELSFSNMNIVAGKGFQAETATDIRFNNVSFTVEEGPSLNIRQCKDIFLNDVRTKQPIAGQPVVDLEAIENLSIIHCDSTQIVRK